MRLLAWIVCGVLLWPRAAAADDPARARQLFQEAGEARVAGRWDEARTLLEQSLAASPRFPTAWNLVTVLEHEGDIVGAEQLLVRTRAGAFGALAEAEQESVAARIAELTPRIATVVLAVPGGAGAEVRLAGEPAARVDASGQVRLRVSPGAPVLSVQAQDGRTAQKTVTIGPGETLAVELRLPALPVRTGRLVVEADDRARFVEIVGVARARGHVTRELPPDRYRVRLAGDDRARIVRVREGTTRRVVLEARSTVWWPWVAIGTAILAGGAVTIGVLASQGDADPVGADFSGPPL